jgi:hypothetical protein
MNGTKIKSCIDTIDLSCFDSDYEKPPFGVRESADGLCDHLSIVAIEAAIAR